MVRLILCCLVFTFALGGCVKKASYNKTGKPVNTAQVNADEAARTRIALGLQYLKIREMSSAKFNLEKALTFSPRLPAAHAAMAHYYQTVGEMELAEKAFIKALSFDGDDPDTLNNYGAFLCRVKRFEEAEKTFLKAIKVPSYLKVAESYENAALCAMENKDFAKAKGYFAQSLDHSELRANTLINMAALSYAMGEFRDAQKYGQRLSNIGVISPRVLLLRALTELKLGNLTQSKKHGTTLVSMYVKSPEALTYLSKNFDDSEFEQLRRLYLKDQYEKYKAQLKQDKRTASSKTKVKKKLKPTTMEDVAVTQADRQVNLPESTVAANNPPETTEMTGTAQSKPKMVSLLSRPQNKTEEEVPPPPVQTPEQTPASMQPSNAQIPTQQPDNTQANSGFVSLVGKKDEVADKPQAGEVKPEQNPEPSKVIDATDKKREVPFHIVQFGESMYGISIKYNIRIRSLMDWNNIANQNDLKVGQKIYLDQPLVYHKILEGDTLYKISVKYRVSMEKLLQWNELTLDSRLTLGQKILVVDPEQLTL